LPPCSNPPAATHERGQSSHWTALDPQGRRLRGAAGSQDRRRPRRRGPHPVLQGPPAPAEAHGHRHGVEVPLLAQHLLPDYQRNIAELDGLYYEPRGELHHPHTGEVLRLGTREVEAYALPEWEFDKILYIEKSGLQAQLAAYQIGQRYDMAIIYGNGYSPVACRDLLARSGIRDITIFVLHDGDLDGYVIARTFGEATKRMPNHSVDVVDLGLTVPQAISGGLETEADIRKCAIPSELVLDDDALRWFTGTPFSAPGGKTHYNITRCELNAFSSDGLAEFIEARLADHGVVGKLVPPADVLDPHVEDVRDDRLDDLIWDLLRELIDFDEVVTLVKERHPEVVGTIDEDRVRGWFDATARNNTKPWGTAVERLIDADIAAVTSVKETVKELITEQLRATGEQS
jgi:hypothetical protein